MSCGGDNMAGFHLRQLRLERGITQIKLQMDTGIDQALISKYESGGRMIPTETLLVLADYYGTNLDYLLDRTDDPTPFATQGK